MKRLSNFLIVIFLSVFSSNVYSQLNVTITPPYSTSICSGMGPSLVADAQGGTHPYHYNWSPSEFLNNDTIYNPYVIFYTNIDTVITYTVIVTDSLGLTDTASIAIYISKVPSFFITSTAQNYTICSGMSTQLTCHPYSEEDNYSYDWPYYMGSLSSQTGSSVIAFPTTSVSYMVTGINGGCTSTTSIYIQVNNCNYNILHGEVFNDINSNGIKDIAEHAMPSSTVSISPASSVFSYVMDSVYTAYTDNGTFTVSPADYPYYSQTTNPNITFSSFTTEDTLDVGIHANASVKDLKIDLELYYYSYFCPSGMVCLYGMWWVHPWSGNVAGYGLTYKNAGTDTLNGVIKIMYDTLFDNFGTLFGDFASDSVLSITGDTLTWQYINLVPGEERLVHIGGMDTSSEIGSVHTLIAIGYPLTGDTVPSDNIDTLHSLVTGSWDPNFKEVSDTMIFKEEVGDGFPLTYAVHFQNTGNDTAYIVKLIDTLSMYLDISTFQMISASHPYSLKISSGNILEWTFNNILLPDSGANHLQSNGYVKFRINTFSELQPGDSINNYASIFFDNNPAVNTNSVLTQVTLLTNEPEIKNNSDEMLIYPNPAEKSFRVKFLSGATHLIILNTIGQIIQNISVEGYSEKEIEIMQSGIYFIQLVSDKNVITKKVIIQ